jgi:hypothetical protein
MATNFVGLDDTGTFYYNGVYFKAASSITVSQEALLDGAGLGTKYNEITIRVRAVVTVTDRANPAGKTTDTPMEIIRSCLCKHGGHLIFDRKGFGYKIEVNNPQGSMRDVNFGPCPQLLSWTPIGNDKAAEVEWAVKICVPHCYYPNIPTVGIMSFFFGVSWSLDEQGLTTRTISGSYEIAMTTIPTVRARENRQLPDSAEGYWRDTYKLFRRPTGFKRTHNRTLSPNMKVMDFTITDTEIASNNPYPEGVTSITARHQLSWGRAEALKTRNTISASITLRPGLNGTWAWAIFTQIVRQRMRWAMEHRSRKVTPYEAKKFVLLDSLNISEDLFGHTHQFSASYRFLSSISDLVGTSGLWTPLGTDWSRWEYSLEKAGTARGQAGLTQKDERNWVYDLCGGRQVSDSPDVGLRDNTWTMPAGHNYMENIPPPRDASWSKYDVVVLPSRDSSTSRQQILQSPDNPWFQQNDGPFRYERIDGSGGNGGNRVNNAVRRASGTPGTSPDNPWLNPQPPRDNTPPYPPPSGGTSQPAPIADVIHRSGLGAYWIKYIGHAERVGWEIPRQHLAMVGGVPTTEVSNQHACRTIGNYLGVTVYAADWCHVYTLPYQPLQVDCYTTGQVPALASDWR